MRRNNWQEKQTPVSLCCNIRIYRRQTSWVGLETSAGLLTAFHAAVLSPWVLVPPLVGITVSEASLFLCICIVFQPLHTQILNYQYRLSCD